MPTLKKKQSPVRQLADQKNFLKDKEEIPEYLRETIQRMIDIKVKRRVEVEMSNIKQDLVRRLE